MCVGWNAKRNLGGEIEHEQPKKLGENNHLTWEAGNLAFVQASIPDTAEPCWSAAGAQESFIAELGPALADHAPKRS